MKVTVLGGGAFGIALAMVLSRDGTRIALWTRSSADADTMRNTRKSSGRLPGLDLPPSLEIPDSIPDADVMLLAVPAQSVRTFLEEHLPSLKDRILITCAKGIERGTGLGPVDLIRTVVPGSPAGCLTGPSFAADIAIGLPTALVLAIEKDADAVQQCLNRPALRVYRTTDITGAQLGGSLKNIMAIAAGIAIGAGLGDSARASVIARGFAEMSRYARHKGAESETIQGLSGLGDLVLTCASEKSRNFTAGRKLGKGEPLNPAVTVEGIATAQAVSDEAQALGTDMPITRAVAAVTRGELDIPTAIETLLARPAGRE